MIQLRIPPLLKVFFSYLTPIQGVVTVSPLSNFEEVVSRHHFEIVQQSPMKCDYLP